MFGESLSSTPSLSSPWSGRLSASTPPSIDPSPSLAPEVDTTGNLEYKLKILPPSMERLHRLVTQLKWRLFEGGGVAVYEVGVLDDGTLVGLDEGAAKDSIKVLSKMAGEVGATVKVRRVVLLEEEGVKTLNQDEAVQMLKIKKDNELFTINIHQGESDEEQEEDEQGFAFSLDLDEVPIKPPRRRRRNTRSLRLKLEERQGAGLPIPTLPTPRFGNTNKHLAIAISNAYTSVMRELGLHPERTEPYGPAKIIVEAVITSEEGEGFVDYTAGVTV